jgi:uncharacterized membrane protein
VIPSKLHDVGFVIGVLIVASLVLLVPGVPWPIEWAFGIPFLLVLPGYAVVTALLPTPPESPRGSDDGPGWPARVALALVTSVLVVATVGTLLALWGMLRLGPVVFLVSAVTLVGVLVGVVRRRSLPADRRVFPAVPSPIAGGRTDAVSTVQTVAMVLAILALGSALAVVGASPGSQGSYTEVYLLSPGADTGTNTTEMTTFVPGERSTVELGITNHQPTAVSQGIVIQLERVGPDGAVRERELLNRFRVRLAPQENAVYDREVAPTMDGERLRLQVLLYENEIPDEPRPETATLSLRQWVTVDAGTP